MKISKKDKIKLDKIHEQRNLQMISECIQRGNKKGTLTFGDEYKLIWSFNLKKYKL